jgi:hypothetical protein
MAQVTGSSAEMRFRDCDVEPAVPVVGGLSAKLRYSKMGKY